MIRWLFFCSSLLLYTNTLNITNATAASLSLEQALQRATEVNRSLVAKSRSLDATEARLQASKAGRLPRLNWQSSGINSNAPMAVFGSKLSQQSITAADFAPASLNRPASRSWYQHRLTLDIPLYRGGAIGADIHRHKAQLLAGQQSLQQRRQHVLYAVYSAYTEVLRAQYAKAAARQAKKSADRHLESAKRMLSEGMLLKSDVMDAEVHQLNAAISIRQTSNRYDHAKDELRHLLAMPLQQDIELEDWAGIDQVQLEHGEDWWQKQAISHRSDLAAMQAAATASQAEVDLSRANFRPRVGIQAAQEWNNNTLTPQHGNHTIAANIQWNIFSGGADRSHLRAAQANAASKLFDIEDLQQSIQVQVRDARRQLEETASRWQARQRAEKQSRESLRIHQLRFDQGMENINTMLDAQTRLDASALASVNARFDHYMAGVRLRFVSGMLGSDHQASEDKE